MSLILFPFLGFVILLLFVILWTSLRPARNAATRTLSPDEATSLEDATRRHSTYLPLLRQALSPPDFQFVTARGSASLARQLRKDRRRAALMYLANLRIDFERLLRLARAVALLSPQVGARQEVERARLSLQFAWRYEMVRCGLFSGILLLPQIGLLSEMVSALAVQMDAAIRELGERAALAADLASSLDRRGVHLA